VSGKDEFFSDERTSGFDGVIELPEGGYQDFLFDRDDPLLTRYRGMHYDDYAQERVAPDFVQELLADWERLYREPFRGVSTDGRPIDGLYPLPIDPTNDSAARLAAERVLERLSLTEREQASYWIDDREWRAWSNPEFVIHPVGVRLEDVGPTALAAVHELMRASLSVDGYAFVRELMDLNGLLGELTGLPTIMSPLSYQFSIFGTPSDDEPWGWQLFGHHVALNVVFVGGRVVIAPVFLGAEPAASIEGRPTVFAARVATSLELAASLSPSQRADAVVYDSILDPTMPDGRLHPADERHLAGAFRDNRVIPYEGVTGRELSNGQWDLVIGILEDFLVLLPDAQRAATIAGVASHRDETRFAWYGATDGSQPFYFRIQGPVILAELDHHAGVWLTNQVPARFHIHTTLRLPNGNDYGRRYISEWRDGRGDQPHDDRWTA
jgi:hypothetical protein